MLGTYLHEKMMNLKSLKKTKMMKNMKTNWNLNCHMENVSYVSCDDVLVCGMVGKALDDDVGVHMVGKA
ncbi:hypothetical protein NBO_582g0003 [Nosema bombycis CQ1]|uniref:Uncharacterized protein n=1 Tax=Nosema bombycis (strain CQ1 / CVCC 102059) TaxID=578461 RepID=R0M1Y1_NOSB1|nr:hypothetical protein NBO_582g0003 [Nosema bombycis CQ1]|eukprot:EOB12034.1 hypothetical protein NBO_582g0003 [Nosema bombycis CQ1]